MAVKLEFINLLVPITKVDAHYPGGFKQFCEDNRSLIGGRIWFDEYLLRDGAMSPQAMEAAVQYWTQFGLVPFEERDGKQAWCDMCVVEELAGGPTLPCGWIEVDMKERCAYLRSGPRGESVGREDMTQDRY